MFEERNMVLMLGPASRLVGARYILSQCTSAASGAESAASGADMGIWTCRRLESRSSSQWRGCEAALVHQIAAVIVLTCFIGCDGLS